MGSIAINLLKLTGTVVAIHYGLKWGFRAGSQAGSWLTNNVGGKSVGTFAVEGGVFIPRIVKVS